MKTRTLALALTLTIGLTSMMACKTSAQNNDKAEVVKITEQEFYDKVFDLNEGENPKFKGNKPVVVDFYATWCGPCKKMSPVLDELAAEFGDQVEIYKVDIDDEKKLARLLGIRSIPTFLLVDSEGRSSMVSGMMEKAVFKSKINGLFKK